MAFTQQQLEEAAKAFVDKVFVSDNVTAHSTKTEIVNAFDQVDTAMAATGDQIVSAGYGSTALKAALLDYARNGAPNLTTQEGGIVLAYWALKEVGLI